MADASIVASITAELASALDAVSEPATRAHWEAYLKGTAAFRGVPMAGIRQVVRALWREHELATWTTYELFELTDRWFASPLSEDKLAAVLLLAEQMPRRLTTADAGLLAGPLERGHLADWNSCDWYATKSLHGFVAGADDLEARARAVAGWSHADNLWQRRAGVVAFAKLAASGDPPFPGFVDLVLDACAANLVVDDRFAHTGPGWVLRELSRHHPDAVQRFVDDHPELSSEGRRMATARLRRGPYRRR